ncbi:uncharacterized protein LOC133713480 isoform X2 [Rosa rugosa]|uniref:uncharacterized protein LOC133713480 isoform X2 n=1 Tax=Rosa rugosa TaxID=74645 RepID=UPI002B4167DE|nr:uncharacterized protein LOC133713480 isoform X2 [Rosa rugosa]
MYLEVADSSKLPSGWTRYAKFSFTLVNQLDRILSKTEVRKGDIKILDNETGELMDFKDLVRIELAFHPLLEEVCLSQPSLIECQQRRSRTFFECAFTTLGRLLHFLKTTKVKDLNQDGYDRLQLLWEELECFKFDLTWLQPHVQSVFGMKNMAGRVARMREDVNILDNEVKKRRAMLAAAEVDLERAKEDLVKADRRFNKIGDVDCVIGYPLA